MEDVSESEARIVAVLSLNKYKRTEIIQLEISNRRTLQKFTNVEIKQQSPKYPVNQKTNHKGN